MCRNGVPKSDVTALTSLLDLEHLRCHCRWMAKPVPFQYHAIPVDGQANPKPSPCHASGWPGQCQSSTMPCQWMAKPVPSQHHAMPMDGQANAKPTPYHASGWPSQCQAITMPCHWIAKPMPSQHHAMPVDDQASAKPTPCLVPSSGPPASE